MTVDWTQVLTALAAGVPATIVALGTFILGLRNSRKIDDNTEITKDGTSEASKHAKVAAETAASAKVATDGLARQLNGELDVRITEIVRTHVKPLAQAFAEHNIQDEKNMLEIRNAIIDLKNSLKK